MNPATRMPWPTSVLEFGLDLAAKATVLLVVALLLQKVLGRRRAVLGSAAAHAALIGLMLLPFSSLALPSLAIPCLPARPAVGTSDLKHAAISPFAADRIGRFAGDTTPADPPPDNLPVESTRGLALLPRIDAGPPALPHADTSALRAPTTPIEAQPGVRPHFPNTDWATIAVAIYALGASLLLAKVAAAVSAVARLRRSCREVHDPEWTEALERWRRRLGIGSIVVLARSNQVSVPVALGWLRPTIVLPDSLSSPRSAEAIDAVLLHELSHLARGDYARNLVLRIVQAAYWPHFLVWVLGRAIAELRERVCDELCVGELGGPGAYRDALLTVASGIVRRPSPAIGLAMARSSKLGRRLAQIERSAGDHRYRAGWPATLFLSTMAITAAGVLGAAQLVRAEPRATAADDPPKAAAFAPSASDAGRVFRLRVVASGTNEPVPDATVRVSMAFRHELRKTDARGHLDIAHSTGPSDQTLSIDLWGKGRAMQRYYWDNNSNQPIPDAATIPLQPGESLGGIVNDEAGRPVSGATVYLWSHNYKRKDPHELLYDLRAVTGPDGKWQTSGAPETTGELLGFKVVHPDFLSIRNYRQRNAIPKISELRAGKAVTILKKGVPIEGRVVDGHGQPVAGARVLSADEERAMFLEIEPFGVVTDATGRFRTGQVKPGKWYLFASAKGHAPADAMVTIGKAVPQVEIALGWPRPFKGRVLDLDGKPVAGAFFDPDVWRKHRSLGAFYWSGEDGRFRWDDAPDDELIVNVNAPGYRGVFQQHVAPSSAEHEFRIAPALTIEGKVIDAETKKRVDNALVEYSAVDPKTGESSKWTNLPEVGFGAGAGVYRGNLAANFPLTESAYKIRVRSPGYRNFISRTFRREEKVVLGYEIVLVPGTDVPVGSVATVRGPIATVRGPDGKPLGGARVVEVQAGGHLNLENGAPNLFQARKVRDDRTSPDGKFAIPDDNGPCFILILGEDSYALTDQDSLKKSPTIQAKPYGRIEGQVFVGSHSVPDQELELTGTTGGRFRRMCNVFVSQTTKSDRDGRFKLEKVIPGQGLRIVRKNDKDLQRGVWSIGTPVRVEPGATARVVVGGSGRPVIGRVEPPVGWTKPIDFTDRSDAHLESDRPWNPIPVSLFRGKTALPRNEIVVWNQQWSESQQGWDYADGRIAIGAPIGADGSFRIDDVPPGDYRLAIRVNGESAFHDTLTVRRDKGPFLRAVKTFTMPEAPRARRDPLDLGVVQLQPRVVLQPGQPAPAFEAATVEGKKLNVPGDFRGKFLLLDFGTTWDVQSRHQIPPLNLVYEKFGKDPDPRLATVSLLSAPDTAATRTFIEEKGEPWPQAIVGPLSNPIASLYGIDDENVSTMTLIGPDGRIVATGLWSEKIAEAVAKALGPVDH